MGNGIFSGNPKTEWLSDKGSDRDMRVLDAFWYIDPAGRRWDAPAGTIINGASIPRTLWSSVGSPYTGDYRRAALVHDAAMGKEGIRRADADTMFYYACLAGGCSLLQAKMLYAGVRVGAWASNTQVLSMDPAAQLPDGYRLPGQQSPRELEVRARYTVIANQLMATSDNFADIERVVNKNLGTPPGP
ncbi:DUF1353 domain-containing protein [Massilia sp. CF038]|uniref:DUF1353 domain-containing protein n=1 Tax=Massilia sp. CF038 TaxID=1881045 RepID=UPI0009220315|nr:DUF1353 domain-containing protein [Massilia sp. CF038]SHG67119.1 Protein of unknown function [Massilia sp. CF038]